MPSGSQQGFRARFLESDALRGPSPVCASGCPVPCVAGTLSGGVSPLIDSIINQTPGAQQLPLPAGLKALGQLQAGDKGG